MLRTFILRTEDNAKSLYAFLKANWRAMAAKEKPLAVTVAQYKAKRSQEQNKRLWAILREISAQCWVDGKQYSPEAWAEYYKQMLIGYENGPKGCKVGISTATLNTAEFTEYMEKIEADAADMGVELNLLT